MATYKNVVVTEGPVKNIPCLHFVGLSNIKEKQFLKSANFKGPSCYKQQVNKQQDI